MTPGPRDSGPTVRRAVISLDAGRRLRLLDVLDFVEYKHHFIDPDMYRIDLDEMASLKALFTTENEDEYMTISFTYDDLVALEVIIDAADTYSNGYGGTGIAGVSNPQLADLRRWVVASERWFFKD